MADTWQAISGYASNNYSDTMVFEVDGATKKLQKISGQTLIAGEKNSQYIRFMMPRYWDGIDVSEKTISIIYGLAGQYYGETAAISAERTDDSLRFGWVVPEEACCIAGTLLFILVIKDSTYVLKSQITEVPVLKSINLDDVIPEPTKEAWYADFQVRVERTLSAAENAVEEAQSTLAQARSLIGSPLVANTAADMADTSRIYVYTGSETGYTNGHWYYHTGSAWTDGGVYNAVAVDTDTTLSISGKAADAKKTGDEIEQIKEELSEYEGVFTANVDESVQNWLDEHPEATTTVQDGSITQTKINSDFLALIKNGAVTPQMYGAKGDGVADDTQAIQDAIDDNPKSTVYFPAGSYKISTPIKTWPDNAKYVNLVFDMSADVFTETEDMPCLFYVGGYDLDSNYGTTATLGYKKFFYGGRFNGANCEYAIKVSSATCDLQIMNCLLYNCNSGILLGHVATQRSTDSVIAYCNIVGTNAADSYGVKYSKADNKIQHCRIYGFKTCIFSQVGGLYAFDIHTLDLSSAPVEYDCDDSCCIDLYGGGRNTLIAVYGNGEGTFLRLDGSKTNLIKVIDCEYRNWTLGNSDFVFIDVKDDEGRIHLVCTGNTVVADDATGTDKVRYGIRGITVSTDIEIKDNILWGTEYLTDRGDLICQTLGRQYASRQTEAMTANHWYYVGAMKMYAIQKIYKLNVTVGLNRFHLLLMASKGNLATTNVYARRVEYMPNAGTYKLGFIQNDDTVEWYVSSDVTPAISTITILVEEPDKSYYLGNIYKIRSNDAGYTQKDLGGDTSTFSVDKAFTFTNS